MVEFGAKPIEAIRAATVGASHLLSIEGKAGVIKAGSYADIIAVESDPRVRVDQLEHVKFVMKGGVVYKDDWTPALALQGR